MKASFKPADILIPRGVEMEKWSVVACDQFTSQRDYWQETERIAGDAPSTLRMILPEVYLGDGDGEMRAKAIRETMDRYLKEGLFETLPDALIYVERTLVNGSIRRGIIGAVDLDAYDYNPGAVSDIRATEKTVVERIPPRMAVRTGAPLELPHIILLCDDDERVLIEPIAAQKDEFRKLYDFETMQGGGHIAGWLVSGEAADAFCARLETYTDEVGKKYEGLRGTPMTFAVGDGNHSLATAKACWEAYKAAHAGEDLSGHPARYALLELENIHDEAQNFEPIHRIVTETDAEALLSALTAECGAETGHRVEWIMGERRGEIFLNEAISPLAVGVLQGFLDRWAKEHPMTIDYIHGEEVVCELAKQPSSIGFLLPPMEKGQLFRGVIADGALPRKTFSMGHAQEKRCYLEARRIL